MKRLPLAVAVALLTSAPAGVLNAQWWGGCRDALGTPVIEYADPTLGDIARATIVNGGPVIIYNPQVVLSVNPSTRRFFYFHECGHHALGQVITGQNIPFQSEQEADCWAARTLVDRGEFTAADLRAVQSDISQSPGDWTHLPGPQRALNLVRCLGNGCRTVTDWEERTTWQTQYAPQAVPCTHWICGYYGCGFRDPYDVVMVPQQVPVRERVPVTRRVCD